jgi:hypothetical protein
LIDLIQPQNKTKLPKKKTAEFFLKKRKREREREKEEEEEENKTKKKRE